MTLPCIELWWVCLQALLLHHTFVVLHPGLKLEYFRNQQWEQEWITQAEKLVHDKYASHYQGTQEPPAKEMNASDGAAVSFSFAIVLLLTWYGCSFSRIAILMLTLWNSRISQLAQRQQCQPTSLTITFDYLWKTSPNCWSGGLITVGHIPLCHAWPEIILVFQVGSIKSCIHATILTNLFKPHPLLLSTPSPRATKSFNSHAMSYPAYLSVHLSALVLGATAISS